MKNYFYLGVGIIITIIVALLVYGVYLNHRGENEIAQRMENLRLPLRGSVVQQRTIRPMLELELVNLYSDDMTDAAKWVECDYCNKWEHFDCELQKGKTYSSVQELNDVKNYMCPICRNKKNGEKNMDNKIQKN